MDAPRSGKAWNSSLPNRRKPLRAKKPWRRGKPNFDKRIEKVTRPAPKPMRKVSKALAKKLRENYYPARSAFLIKFPWCMICAVRGFPPRQSTEVHHIFGRSGKNLHDERGFCASCRGCRDFPHDNPSLARELGVLAMPADFNRPITPEAFARLTKINA